MGVVFLIILLFYFLYEKMELWYKYIIDYLFILYEYEEFICRINNELEGGKCDFE